MPPFERKKEDIMPHLSPPTLTEGEQRTNFRKTACNPRDYLIYSLALETEFCLAEIVGLNLSNVYSSDWKPWNRLGIRPEVTRGGGTYDVFLPDALAC